MKPISQRCTYLQLTPEETALVYSIANSNTPVAFEARCIRYLTHGEEYEVPLPPLPQEVLNGNWQTYINFKGANSNNAAMVGFYPNPAGNLINIQYNASPNNTPAILEWYSTTGKLIHNLSLPQAGNYTLNVGQWTNGLYFCKVIQNGNLISVQKVMIAR
ncbi:MAG TPA: T9SS type A sorting domain-containing protein [Chitinophagales bacterium]|nr:T9SS type A sorting domain-containing protein [Chitinophagales bacterium]